LALILVLFIGNCLWIFTVLPNLKVKFLKLAIFGYFLAMIEASS